MKIQSHLPELPFSVPSQLSRALAQPRVLKQIQYPIFFKLLFSGKKSTVADHRVFPSKRLKLTTFLKFTQQRFLQFQN